MKVWTIFLALFLWTETPQASVAEEDEPFMEIKTAPADDEPSGNQETRQASKKDDEEDRKPLSEMEFYNAKLINTSESIFDGLLMPKAGMFESIFDIFGNNGMLSQNPRWPNATVPYSISNVFDNGTRLMIARTFLEYHTRTCIRFVPKNSTDEDYVNIVQSEGCYSVLGHVGGKQDLSLGKGCEWVKVIVHELMHAIGFIHEQSRPDRDKYVTIAWDNVEKGMEGSFDKSSWEQLHGVDEPYDYTSVMHYDAYSMAVDRSKPVIIPKEKDKLEVIGRAESFSDIDLKKIKKLYKCEMNGANKIGGDCEDSGGWCADYAKNGDCDTYPAWMKTICMKSCGMCGGKCTDHGSNCAEWSGQGLCETNSGYMKAFCKKSCKVCNY